MANDFWTNAAQLGVGAFFGILILFYTGKVLIPRVLKQIDDVTAVYQQESLATRQAFERALEKISEEARHEREVYERTIDKLMTQCRGSLTNE